MLSHVQGIPPGNVNNDASFFVTRGSRCISTEEVQLPNPCNSEVEPVGLA